MSIISEHTNTERSYQVPQGQTIRIHRSYMKYIPLTMKRIGLLFAYAIGALC